ncbi:hypothetical protein Tco_0929877, partial [Tanacetum coccineum]
DEAWINLNDEENDFLLADVPEDEIEELNATCIMMARIQSVINDPDIDPEFVSEVHTSESCFMDTIFSNDNHKKSQHETIKPSYDDDQIDCSIIFDDSDGEEAAKGDSRWDALVISPRDGYFDPMEFYSAPSSEPRALRSCPALILALAPKNLRSIRKGSGSLGYKNPCLLKKVIVYNPKLYDVAYLLANNVHVHVHDSKETLEDAEKNRLKMKDKQNDEKVQEKKIKLFPIDYAKLLETTKENDFLKIVLGRLLKASLADIVRDILMHSYVEIQNDNLRKAVVRITKESNDIQ